MSNEQQEVIILIEQLRRKTQNEYFRKLIVGCESAERWLNHNLTGAADQALADKILEVQSTVNSLIEQMNQSNSVSFTNVLFAGLSVIPGGLILGAMSSISSKVLASRFLVRQINQSSRIRKINFTKNRIEVSKKFVSLIETEMINGGYRKKGILFYDVLNDVIDSSISSASSELTASTLKAVTSTNKNRKANVSFSALKGKISLLTELKYHISKLAIQTRSSLEEQIDADTAVFLELANDVKDIEDSETLTDLSSFLKDQIDFIDKEIESLSVEKMSIVEISELQYIATFSVLSFIKSGMQVNTNSTDDFLGYNMAPDVIMPQDNIPTSPYTNGSNVPDADIKLPPPIVNPLFIFLVDKLAPLYKDDPDNKVFFEAKNNHTDPLEPSMVRYFEKLRSGILPFYSK